MAARSRPLSPHLSIYRFTLTMANSIIHRGTGVAMYFGTLLIVLWLGAAALGDGPFGLVNAIYGFWLVQVVFFLATWALFHHMLGGIRHFIWDSIHALDPVGRETITRIQFVLSILLTLGAWALFVWFK
ncbi:MAG: succinate dehydrogenase, cytochrome b556 subunit [Devosia sp.]|jgi:succinate dehydrogenase / fumarate reductase cytochrome b subunit